MKIRSKKTLCIIIAIVIIFGALHYSNKTQIIEGATNCDLGFKIKVNYTGNISDANKPFILVYIGNYYFNVGKGGRGIEIMNEPINKRSVNSLRTIEGDSNNEKTLIIQRECNGDFKAYVNDKLIHEVSANHHSIKAGRRFKFKDDQVRIVKNDGNSNVRVINHTLSGNAPKGNYVAGSWSSCSKNCGGGTQTRTVTCRTPDGRESTNCSDTKPPTTQSCNNEACSYSTTEWSSCSEDCDGGTQTRTVTCKTPDGRVVSDANCSDTKPSDTRPCNDQACETYNWNESGWSSCSEVCGGGTQTRTVTCKTSGPDGSTVDDAYCTSTMPSITRPCNDQACETYNWNESGWSSCSEVCGGGTQTRTVTCKTSGPDGSTVDDAYCTSTMPSITRPCNDQACNIDDSKNNEEQNSKCVYVTSNVNSDRYEHYLSDDNEQFKTLEKDGITWRHRKIKFKDNNNPNADFQLMPYDDAKNDEEVDRICGVNEIQSKELYSPKHSKDTSTVNNQELLKRLLAAQAGVPLIGDLMPNRHVKYSDGNIFSGLTSIVDDKEHDTVWCKGDRDFCEEDAPLPANLFMKI